MFIKRNNYEELLKKVEILEEGKLTLHNELDESKTEIFKLKTDIVEQCNNINKQSKDIKEYNKTVTLTSDKYDKLKQQVSDEIQNISAVTEETSASTEEVTASAEQIKERIQSAVDGANNNTKILESIVGRVKVLKDSSDNLIISFDDINKVTTVIKSIADQLKLLGLNASIEAARVGDAGKGFGVVAREMQKLAETTKSEAIEIINVIDKNSNSVGGINTISNELKEETAQLLESNAVRLENITEINESMAEISTAVQQIAEVSTQTAVEIQTFNERL